MQLNRLTGGGCETGSKTDVVFCTRRVRCGGPPMSATGKGDWGQQQRFDCGERDTNTSQKASRVTESMSDFYDLHQADTVMMTCYRTNCLEEDFSALKESDKRRATFLLRPLCVKKKGREKYSPPSKEKQVPSSSPPCRVSSFQPLASPFVDGHHSMTCPASPPSTTCVSRGGGKWSFLGCPTTSVCGRIYR